MNDLLTVTVALRPNEAAIFGGGIELYLSFSHIKPWVLVRNANLLIIYNLFQTFLIRFTVNRINKNIYD